MLQFRWISSEHFYYFYLLIFFYLLLISMPQKISATILPTMSIFILLISFQLRNLDFCKLDYLISMLKSISSHNKIHLFLSIYTLTSIIFYWILFFNFIEKIIQSLFDDFTRSLSTRSFAFLFMGFDKYKVISPFEASSTKYQASVSPRLSHLTLYKFWNLLKLLKTPPTLQPPA